MAPSILLRDEATVIIMDTDLTAEFAGGQHDVDISDLNNDAPVMIW